jgi:hypothetical protein
MTQPLIGLSSERKGATNEKSFSHQRLKAEQLQVTALTPSTLASNALG